jgi:hypothetical protein
MRPHDENRPAGQWAPREEARGASLSVSTAERQLPRTVTTFPRAIRMGCRMGFRRTSTQSGRHGMRWSWQRTWWASCQGNLALPRHRRDPRRRRALDGSSWHRRSPPPIPSRPPQRRPGARMSIRTRRGLPNLRRSAPPQWPFLERGQMPLVDLERLKGDHAGNGVGSVCPLAEIS